jgi:formate dehydrogenase maturation protein FdhE
MSMQTLVPNTALSTPERPVTNQTFCPECGYPSVVSKVAGRTADAYIMHNQCKNCKTAWYEPKER